MDQMGKIRVTDRTGRQLEVNAEVGSPLMYTLRVLPDSVDAICGGMCSCGTCHVYIAHDWTGRLPPPAEDELELLEELDNTREGSRLSCQVRFTDELDGLELEVAPAE
jgi:2Fe-2S ferredoxin